VQHKRTCANKINNPSTGAKRVMGFFRHKEFVAVASCSIYTISNKHNIPKTTRTHPFFTRAARLAIILFSHESLLSTIVSIHTHIHTHTHMLSYIILVCFSARPFVLCIFLRHTRSSLVSVPTDPVPDGLSSPNEKD